jgi:hypothetical protein
MYESSCFVKGCKEWSKVNLAFPFHIGVCAKHYEMSMERDFVNKYYVFMKALEEELYNLPNE